MDNNKQNTQTEYTEDQRLHLQMVQDVITRMASNSFAMKGWMTAIVAAFIALYVDKGNPWLLIAPILPTVVFWCLDAKYLQLERKFRGLYNDVRKGEVLNYSMDITPYVKPNSEEKDETKCAKQNQKYGFCNVFWSITMWPLYFITILILAGLFGAGFLGWIKI